MRTCTCISTHTQMHQICANAYVVGYSSQDSLILQNWWYFIFFPGVAGVVLFIFHTYKVSPILTINCNTNSVNTCQCLLMHPVSGWVIVTIVIRSVHELQNTQTKACTGNPKADCHTSNLIFHLDEMLHINHKHILEMICIQLHVWKWISVCADICSYLCHSSDRKPAHFQLGTGYANHYSMLLVSMTQHGELSSQQSGMFLDSGGPGTYKVGPTVVVSW